MEKPGGPTTTTDRMLGRLRAIEARPSRRTAWFALVLGILYCGSAVLLLPRDVVTPAFIGWSVALATTLIGLTIIDIALFRLPNVATYPLIAVGCFVGTDFDVRDIAMRLAAAAVGYALLYATAWAFRRWRGREGLGMGDAKLFAAAGAWLGIAALPTVLLLASCLGIASALIAMLAGAKVEGSTRIPFGPFLAAGFWIVWLLGPIL